MTRISKLSASACMAAALSMTVAPAAAVELPTQAVPNAAPVHARTGDVLAVNAEHYRYRRWRHRNRVDAGDVLTGVLILGGIAAIANSVSKPRRERSYPVRQPASYPERRSERSSNSGQGIDRAVDMCLSEIERDVRVDNVDNVSRTGAGWTVTGTIYNGDAFTCRIDNEGRISSVDFGGQVATSTPVQDNQWDDERYRQARADLDAAEQPEPVETAMADEQPLGPQPAYPGGPIDGDIPAEEELGG